MKEQPAATTILDYRFKILVIVALLTPLCLQLTESWIFKISDDIIFSLILVDALIAVKKKGIKTTYDLTCVVMMSLLALSLLAGAFFAIISDNKPMVVFLQFRQYRYLFMFLVLLYYSGEDIFGILYKSARFMAYLSVPVAIAQRFLISADTGDVVTGLYGYGASGTMTLFLLILFFAEFSYRLSRGMPLAGWYLLFWIPLGLNETKITFFITPVLFIVALVAARKLNLKNVAILVLCAACLLYATGLIYNSMYKTNILTYYNQDTLKAYMYDIGQGDMGRLQKIKISLDIIGKKTPLGMMIGYGLGAGYSGQVSQNSGVVADKYDAGNLFAGTRPQIFNSLIDTGLFGVAVQFLFVVVLLFKLLLTKTEYKMLHYTAIFSLVILFFGLLYEEILTISNISFFIFTSVYLAFIIRPEGSPPQSNEQGLYGGRFGMMQIHQMGN